MGILDDPNLSSSDEESGFDPYDNTGKYGQFGVCFRGVNISKSGWCCIPCEKDRMLKRRLDKQARDNIFFEQFTRSETFEQNYRYVKKEEPILQITNDWKILGLIPPKTKKELKKRYRQLILKHHPDKGGNSEQFVKITDSYNTLCLVC